MFVYVNFYYFHVFMECALISKAIVMQKWGDIYGGIGVHREEDIGAREEDKGWSSVGEGRWSSVREGRWGGLGMPACGGIESQSHSGQKWPWEIMKVIECPPYSTGAQGSANSSFAFSFFSAFIDLQSLSLPPFSLLISRLQSPGLSSLSSQGRCSSSYVGLLCWPTTCYFGKPTFSTGEKWHSVFPQYCS